MTGPSPVAHPATRDEVLRAVKEVSDELRTDLVAYNFVLYPDRLLESYGGWLLPAELHGSAAMRKSYDLHRLVEKIEDRLQDRIGHGRPGATVTIDLSPAARVNGA